MHLRGKDFELRAILPNGQSQTLFRSTWDFNWQLGFGTCPWTAASAAAVASIAREALRIFRNP